MCRFLDLTQKWISTKDKKLISQYIIFLDFFDKLINLNILKMVCLSLSESNICQIFCIAQRRHCYPAEYVNSSHGQQRFHFKIRLVSNLTDSIISVPPPSRYLRIQNPIKLNQSEPNKLIIIICCIIHALIS